MANRNRDVELNLIGHDHTGHATRGAANNLDQLDRKITRFNSKFGSKLRKFFAKSGTDSGDSFSKNFFDTAKGFGATAKVIGGSWAIALGAVFIARAGTYLSAFAPLAIGALGAIPIAVLATTDKITKKAIKGLKSHLLSFLRDVSKPVRPGLLRAIEIIESKTKNLKGPLIGLFKAIGDSLPSLSKGAMGALEALLKSISSESVKAGLIEWGKQMPGIGRSMGKLISAILTDPGTTVQTVKDVVSDLKQLAASGAKIIGALQQTAAAWDTLTTKVDRFEKATSGKGGPLGGMWNAVKRNVPRIIGRIATLPDRARAATRPMEGKIAAVFNRTVARASTGARNIVSRAVGFLRALPGRAGGAVASLWGRMSGAFSRAAGAARGAASRIVNGVISVLRSLPGRAMAALSGLGSAISGRISGMISDARSRLTSGLAGISPFSAGDGGWQFALAGGGGSRTGGPPKISVAAPSVNTRVFLDSREIRTVARSTVVDENKRAAWRARTGAR